jgi:hypothetical protein
MTFIKEHVHCALKLLLGPGKRPPLPRLPCSQLIPPLPSAPAVNFSSPAKAKSRPGAKAQPEPQIFRFCWARAKEMYGTNENILGKNLNDKQLGKTMVESNKKKGKNTMSKRNSRQNNSSNQETTMSSKQSW